ncbi:MAG: 2-amino-4-hydroxy-6-hydroxymethyldihydropteridine diphosphokinase, partial [Planctomycetaceae bacterium]
MFDAQSPAAGLPPAVLKRVFLSLGSNVEPEANLVRAVRMLGEHGRTVGVSRVRETAPLGFADQPNFLNAAVLLESQAALEAWLEQIIPGIERRLGRTRDPGNPHGPRTIDVDVALFGDECRTAGRRRVPDADILTRPFLAAALAELDP